MRNIVSTWHRRGEVVRSVPYARLDTAIPKLTCHAMLQGEPGDVIELSHRHTGLQLGTIKVRVGKLETSWIWDR